MPAMGTFSDMEENQAVWCLKEHFLMWAEGSTESRKRWCSRDTLGLGGITWSLGIWAVSQFKGDGRKLRWKYSNGLL